MKLGRGRKHQLLDSEAPSSKSRKTNAQSPGAWRQWPRGPTAFRPAPQGLRISDYFPVKVKLIGMFSLPVMVTSWVCLPRVSCQAVIVYFPGGKLPNENAPSSPVTE